MLPFITAIALSVLGSVSPHRLYYQVDRPMPVTVSASGGNLELVLLSADNREAARADVPADSSIGMALEPGIEEELDFETIERAAYELFEVDLAELFPKIFELRKAHYVQLLADGVPTGPALVLQPMINRPHPQLRFVQRGTSRVPVVEGWMALSESEQAMSGFRTYRDRLAVLHTTMGDITVAMRPDEAPNTVWNFLHLAEGGFYTDVPVHRVVGADGEGNPFVIQAGDPTGTGGGGPGYSIDLEDTIVPHDLGVISMAREGSDIDTAGSQFFICLSREATARLDAQYGSFGHTVAGLDVVQAIGKLETSPQTQRPLKVPFITSAELIDAPPREPGVRPTYMPGGRDDADAERQDGTNKPESPGGRVDR